MSEGWQLHSHPFPIVPPDGPVEARYALVGEAPGEHESLEGRGFVGPSGGLLWQLMGRVAKLSRYDFRVLNVCWVRPSAENDDPSEEMLDCFREPWRGTLFEMPRLRHIVAVGRYACWEVLPESRGLSMWEMNGATREGPWGMVTCVAHPAAAISDADKLNATWAGIMAFAKAVGR